jgi:hypothetical protein
VTYSGLSLTGAESGNYTLTTQSPASATITAKAVTISNNASTTTYDGTISYASLVSNAGFINTSMVGSDAIGSVTQSIASTNNQALNGLAQAGSFVSTPSAALLSTGIANNYNFSYVAANNTVNKAPLGIVTSGTYSGTTTILSPSVTAYGLQGSDTLTGFTSVTVNTKNVLDNNTNYVTTQSGVVGTANLNNYSITNGSRNAGTGTTANSIILSPAALGIAVSGTYTGTTSIGPVNVTAYGLQNGETLTGFTNATANTKNVVDNSTNYVTTQSGVVGTADLNNYSISNGARNAGTGTTANSITLSQAPLTITAVPNTKTFDGSDSALSTPIVSGLKGTDTISSLTETYASFIAGINKTLNVSNYSINDGSGGANYRTTLVANLNGTINVIPAIILPPLITNTPPVSSVPPLSSTATTSTATVSSAPVVTPGSAGPASTVTSAGVSVTTVNNPSQSTTGLIVVTVPQSTAVSGTGLTIPIPESVIAPVGVTSVATVGTPQNNTVAVTMSNNDPLPSWISYDVASKTLVTSAVPSGALPMSVAVTVGSVKTLIEISESQNK